MKTKLITAKSSDKFLSDVISILPSNCLLNKGVTGCGGTTLEITSNRDSIILVPNINLILNKTNSYKNLIGVYGEITKNQFDKQFINTPYKKIIATYDALPKLINWIGDDIYSYFLLIDEYHILFNSYSLRYNAISAVLQLFRKFKNYCFMTATPLEEQNILKEIQDLDRITIIWPQAVKVQAIVEDVYFTSKRVIELINDSLDGNYNLHIFINSLNTVRSIIKNMNTKNFRTICSKNAEKDDMRLGGKLQVKSINSNVCKVNFYTATAFEGVDIYDPVGKTVVVSDTNVSQSLVDISTLFIQICGRLRDSIYKNQVLFIVNTNNHRYLKYKTDEEFEENSKQTALKAIEYGKEFLLHGQTSININLGAYDDNPIYYQSLYIGRKSNALDFDPNLQKVDKQNYKVINKFFANSLSVIDNLNRTNKIEQIKIINPIYKEIYKVIPSTLTLYYEDVTKLILPILYQNGICSLQKISEVLNDCANKRIIRVNNQRKALYNFVKLKSMIES